MVDIVVAKEARLWAKERVQDQLSTVDLTVLLECMHIVCGVVNNSQWPRARKSIGIPRKT